MNNPFVFNHHVEGEDFTGREWIMARVTEQLLSIRNIILLSPRGWGKTSLAREVSYRIWRYHESYRACFVSIQSGMTVKEFGDELLHQMLLVPGIRTIVSQNEYSYDTEIFNLPEVFAVLNHIKLVVCISGIHNILDLHESSALLTKLSSIWKFHSNCAYLLLGSVSVVGKRNKIKIDSQALKIGNIYFLGRFNDHDSMTFIKKKFNLSGKRISHNAIQMITQFTNQIPYYIQLLAWYSWVNTEKECTIEEVETAIEQITGLFRLYFQSTTEDLTEKQLRFVRLLTTEGYQLYSRDNIAAYDLNTSGHVARLYRSMLNKEIIIDHQDETIFTNPFYKHWLKNHYFR